MARITPYTSPSPKLDSTPALCTTASGQIWRTMPAMNVPCPASKSRIGRPSSLVSSSSSTRPACGDISHLAPGRVRQSVRATCSARRNGRARFVAPGTSSVRRPVSSTSTRGGTLPGMASGTRSGTGGGADGMAVDRITGLPSTVSSVIVPTKAMSPAHEAVTPSGLPVTDLRADDDVVVLGVELGLAQQLEQVGGVADVAAAVVARARRRCRVTDRRSCGAPRAG